ncbi:MAG: hypothetical protein JWM99_3857 [Verrucomicrobiales bacterium]|nr:hypothetical protein [Verrucomicrobiales bacterium]
MSRVILILSFFVGVGWIAPRSSEAQVVLLPKSSRGLGRRAAPPRSPQAKEEKAQVETNALTVATNTIPTNSPVNTNRLIYVRVEPKIDPVKAAAEKQAVLKNAIEFEKGRANNGAAWAQYKLGLRYLNGDGVEKDESAARKWLQAAADNGDSQAKVKLQLLDSKGPGPGSEKAPSSLILK